MRIELLTPEGWNRLSEINQEHLNYFAYARKKDNVIQQLHPWIKCRDYLLDGMFWARDPSLYRCPVYGDCRINNVNLDEVELLFKCEKGRIEKQIHILNEVEKELGISPTEVTRVEDCFYITGDKWWMKTTIHLSTYSLILRTLSYVECSSWKDLENKIQAGFSLLRGKLRKILFALKDSGYDEMLPFKEKTDPETMHNTAGVATFVSAVRGNWHGGFNYKGLIDAYKSSTL